MPIQVEFGGVTHEFPDDFSDADISAALASQDTDSAAPQEQKSLGGFLGNVVQSGADLVGSTYNAAMSPLKTVGGLVTNAAQGQRDVMSAMTGQGEMPQTPGQKRYSSLQHAADTLYADPVGSAVELAPFAKPRLNLSPVKSGLQEAGVRTMRGAVKAPTSELNKMAGASQAGLDAMSDDVAQTALREGVNPMRKRGLETIQQRVDALSQVRDTDIAAAPQVPVQGSGRRQLTALTPVAKKYGPASQTTPEAATNEIRNFAQQMKRNPAMTKARPGGRDLRDLTPDELNALNKGDNRALTGLFGKVGDAEIDARKAVRNERAAMLEDAVPGTKQVGQRLNKLINLRNVANVARKRGEGRDALGINDIISLSSGRPETFLLSTAMRPAVQAGLGGVLHRTGSALPSEIDLTALYRLALLQQLTGEAAPPQ